MKSYKLLLAGAIPILGFVLTLVSISGYKYLRVRDDVATSLIRTLQQAETRELQAFFSAIDQQLYLLREWGRQDLLLTEDEGALNRKLIPVLDQLRQISGIVIATARGQEYFLQREGDGYLSRVSVPAREGSTQEFSSWTAEKTLKKKWREETSYRPQDRIWFQRPQLDAQTYWTPTYLFHHSNLPGVTGAVAWKGKAGRVVIGMDIELDQFSTILSQAIADRPGKLYLFDTTARQIVSSEGSVTGDASRRTLEMIEAWQKEDRPNDEPIFFGQKRDRWLAIFHQLKQEHEVLWLALAAPEQELMKGVTSIRVGAFELIAALLGSGLTFVLWRMGTTRGRRSRVRPELRFQQFITQGEGSRVEFKSTVRMNLKNQQIGREIELAWLKSITAFLNSGGGVLLLGVADNGDILGLSDDGFESEDRCLLHIKNLVNQHIGAEFSAQIEPVAITIDGKMAVMVECRQADQPVFLRIGKNEEFYIRSGPSSIKLSPSQTVAFLANKR